MHKAGGLAEGIGEDDPEDNSLENQLRREEILAFKRKSDLYDLISDLQKAGFDDMDIGALYVHAVRATQRKAKLSSYPGITDKSERGIKRLFEDSVRNIFKKIRNEAVIKRIPKENVLLRYSANPEIGHLQGNTIEWAVEKIIDNYEGAYKKIGEAAVLGSREYMSEKPSTLAAYKVFLEYNRILGKLQSILKEKQ